MQQNISYFVLDMRFLRSVTDCGSLFSNSNGLTKSKSGRKCCDRKRLDTNSLTLFLFFVLFYYCTWTVGPTMDSPPPPRYMLTAPARFWILNWGILLAPPLWTYSKLCTHNSIQGYEFLTKKCKEEAHKKML